MNAGQIPLKAAHGKYSFVMRTEQQSKWIPFLLLGVLSGTTLLVLPYSVTDPINLPKMVFLAIGAMLIFGLMIGSNEFKVRKIQYPFLFLILSFIMVLMSQLLTTSGPRSETFYGTPGRNTGILTYLSFTIIAWISFNVASISIFKKLFTLAASLGLFLATYGIFQELGREPFPYVNVYESNVFGTFGNPNFQSAFLGVIAVLAFSMLFRPSQKLSVKILYGILLTLSLIGVYQTNSIQGFFNFAIGCAIFTFLLLYSKKFYRLSISLAVLIVFGIANVILSFVKVGPLAELIYKGSMSARVYYWDTALRIWTDFPITGVGLDQYGDWLRAYRTTEEVQRNITADSAHSVYLDILSGGGFLLFAPFVFFAIFAIWSIIRVMKRSTTPPIEFLILVGLWTAHQAQSLISIGHIGVAIWGWVFTGMIIGYEIKTRDAPHVFEIDNRLAKKRIKQKAQISPQSILGLFVGLILGCVLALPPFVSSNKYYNSFKTSDARVIKTATYLQPLNRNSFVQVASLLKANKFDQDALEVAKEGVRNFPNSYSLWRVLRDVSPVNSKEQMQALNRLHELDPNNPEFIRK
jgi:O-antigen ligase